MDGKCSMIITNWPKVQNDPIGHQLKDQETAMKKTEIVAHSSFFPTKRIQKILIKMKENLYLWEWGTQMLR